MNSSDVRPTEATPEDDDVPEATPGDAEDAAWSRGAADGHRAESRPQQAWRAYFEATAMLQARLERRLKSETGLTLGPYNVLLLLNEAPEGRMRLGQLATMMVFSPSRMTYQIKALEARGLVKREICEGDRRGAEAILTDEGRAAFRKAATLHARQIREEFLDALDPEDTEALVRIFSRLGRTLEGATA